MLVRSHRGLGAGAAVALAALAALAFTTRELWSTLARPIPVVVLAAAPPPPPRDLRAGDLERLFGVPPPAPTGVPGVFAVGPDRFLVVRRGEEPPLELFGEWPQARVVPAVRHGAVIGFQLFSIRPGSLLAALGVQSGDVLRRINGRALDSPEHGLEIAELLRGATQVVLELERSGRPLRKEYAIDPG